MIQNRKTALTKQSNKNAILRLFTHEEREKPLKARKEKGIRSLGKTGENPLAPQADLQVSLRKWSGANVFAAKAGLQSLMDWRRTVFEIYQVKGTGKQLKPARIDLYDLV